MTTRRTQDRQGRLAFAILVAIVIVSGALLWTQGDLISPLQSTTLLIELSSGETGFAMVGEEGTRPDPPTTSSEQSTTESTTTAVEPDEASPAEQMTLEAFTAELAAAGVDVEAVTANMTAEGRSLENLLAVVNSGRVSVADLAARLQGETNSAPTSESEGTLPSGEGSSELLNLRWDELGSVAYDLWVILATTVLLIVVSRPVGWVVNRLKSVTQSRVGHAVSS
jgi:hypothetical protein